FATAIAITLAVGLSIFKLVTVQGHMNMNWPLKHWVRMSIELYLHAFGAVYWQLGANLPIDAVSIILGPNRRLGPVLSGAFGALLMSYALITMEQQVGNSRVELVSRKVVPVALMVGLAASAGGYLVLLQNFYAGFSPPTGIGNRINIAATLGVAIT